MELDPLSNSLRSELSAFIADAMGLHFPPERWADLSRGLVAAAREWGFEDLASCTHWLLSAPLNKEQLQVLASHLTIGETYFFRDKKTFEILGRSVLPELIESRRKNGRRLRIWSAACSTGEEAYSLAILLRQILPDLPEWRVSILATDINPRSLRHAMAASYGDWSFRDVPPDFKDHYFHRGPDGRYNVIPAIRQMVTFTHLNLVEDGYPSLTTDTNAMDLIFCRNVLMYFTLSQARKVIDHLSHSLVEGGWLIVSPSEASQALFPQFITHNFPGAILYAKGDAPVRIQPHPPTRFPLPPAEPASHPGLALAPPLPPEMVFDSPGNRTDFPIDERSTRHPLMNELVSLEKTNDRPPANENPLPSEPSPYEQAAQLYEQGRYADVIDRLQAWSAQHAPDSPTYSLLTRALANQGRLADARDWCSLWIAADKLNATAYYLQAVVLLEQDEPEPARQALQRAIYLRSDFVLAHFALGNLARRRGKSRETDKHFANALELLTRYAADDLLPESDGLTAGRLAQTISALTELEPHR